MCEDQEATFDKEASISSFVVGKEVQTCNLGILESCHFFYESKFNLFGSDGRQYCWRKNSEHLFDQHMQSTFKHGREWFGVV